MHRRPPSTRLRAGAIVARGQAALVAAMVVLAGLLGMSHEASTRHVRCAEHGELVHATAGGGGGSVEHDAGLRAAPLDRSGAAHEHCGYPCAASARPVPAPAMSVAPTTAALVAPPTLSTRVIATGALYRAAPKTSPPG